MMAGEDICGWRNRATLTPITDPAHTDPSGCPMPSVDQNDNAKLEALREAEGNSGPADDEDDDDPMAQLRYVPEGMKHSDFEIGKTESLLQNPSGKPIYEWGFRTLE
jgi:hypothetical protein